MRAEHLKNAIRGAAYRPVGGFAIAPTNLGGVIGRAAGLTGAYERRFRSQMTIVAFHRVNDQLLDDSLTCTPAKFEAFCQFFRQHFRVVPLSEQVAGCRVGSDMGGTLSITFDDGYLDNIAIAAPILVAYQDWRISKGKRPAAMPVRTK